jgi:predicted RNA-binding Zn ribbon-like protein
VGTVDGDSARFAFVSGALCLDFTNTVANRLGPEPREGLRSYSHLLTWGQQSGAVHESTARALMQQALERGDDADAALRRAIGLREALYRAFSALASGTLPTPADLTILNGALSRAMTYASIIRAGDRDLAWGWRESTALGQVVWPVIRSAAELLTSEDAARVGICANDICGWLFVDATGRRRWCEMRGCGNRAKAAKYYRRHRSTT